MSILEIQLALTGTKEMDGYLEARSAAEIIADISLLVQESEGDKLRDKFAGEAMQGMLASGITLDIDKGTVGLARAMTAYAIADALLEARGQKWKS